MHFQSKGHLISTAPPAWIAFAPVAQSTLPADVNALRHDLELASAESASALSAHRADLDKEIEAARRDAAATNEVLAVVSHL